MIYVNYLEHIKHFLFMKVISLIYTILKSPFFSGCGVYAWKWCSCAWTFHSVNCIFHEILIQIEIGLVGEQPALVTVTC